MPPTDTADAGACPCGSAQALSSCCGRWHAGAQRLQAPDAEALMRSRYSAYVRGLTDYLRDTWHPDTRPADLVLEPGLRWLGLQVRRHLPAPDGASAVVEFVARSKLGGRAHRLHETSRFLRLQPAGEAAPRWFYVDGELHG